MPLDWLLRTILAVVLDFVVLFYLAKGVWKRFPLVAIFCLVQILGTSTDTISFLLTGARTEFYARMFWTGDLVAHSAISLLMISLIWQTLGNNPARKRTVGAVAASVICFAIVSAYIFYNPRLNRWMTPLSRNLSFGEEVLNLILWSILLKGRASDYLLLMVSAGIGVQVTGEVIGHTLRLYTSRSAVWVPDYLVYLCEIMCLCIWIWAFRNARKGQVPRSGAPIPGAAPQASSI